MLWTGFLNLQICYWILDLDYARLEDYLLILCVFVEREVAERSILIKNMIEDIGDQAINEAIPIPNVCLKIRLRQEILTLCS